MNIQLQRFAPTLLRYGLGFVFLWFGFTQLHNPSAWTGFLPQWTNSLSISQNGFVILNGFFEIVGATLLLVGVYVRPVAFLLGVHMLGITLSIGFTAVGIRDLGLSVATFALVLLGAGAFSIDEL